ncbi:MAG: hypothetical protein JSU98_04270 [Gemmatimonadales bacterium]|nr:MAG: hypothetical protein JSU98_04270 [Gemmatimonadales bacterium]
MRRFALLTLPALLLLFSGCEDQPDPLEPTPVTAAGKGDKPGKPGGGGGDPSDPPATLRFTSIETSMHPLAGAFTCAVDDPTGVGHGPVYCWGVNSHYSLGLGGKKKGGELEPTRPVELNGEALHFSEVHLGNQFACAIEDRDGNGRGPIYCWGWNDYDQLGADIPGDQSSPTPIDSEVDEFFALDLGYMEACALAYVGGEVGPMYCWGGPRGTAVPTEVAGDLNFQAVTASWGTICGIDTYGQAWCWELGADPVAVDPSITFTQLAVDGPVHCGLDTSGTILCWGERELNGEIVWSAASPTALALGDGPAAGETHFTSVTPGFCATGASGQAYCWGGNFFGQVGDGSVAASGLEWVEMPSAVGTPGLFSSISEKHDHTCGIAADGFAYCWGANGSGQLGDGTKVASPWPVRVAGQ